MKWKDPNFTCRVTEQTDPPDADRFHRLVYAESEDAARKLLEKKGYVVHSLKPYNFKEEWEEDTKEAREMVEKDHGKSGFKFASLWAALKEHLQDLYHDKCAYCDGSYQAFGYGDVEHFRPKGAVTEDPTHSGYWWLAYDTRMSEF